MASLLQTKAKDIMDFNKSFLIQKISNGLEPCVHFICVYFSVLAINLAYAYLKFVLKYETKERR